MTPNCTKGARNDVKEDFVINKWNFLEGEHYFAKSFSRELHIRKGVGECNGPHLKLNRTTYQQVETILQGIKTERTYRRGIGIIDCSRLLTGYFLVENTIPKGTSLRSNGHFPEINPSIIRERDTRLAWAKYSGLF